MDERVWCNIQHTMKPLFTFERGDSPLLISIPHSGTYVPGEISSKLSQHALELPDTDWFVDRLYQSTLGCGAGVLTAEYSRYVIDLNRSPDDTPLYSGAGTGLVPTTTFDNKPVYSNGIKPDAAETARRTEHYWQPYHDKLAIELDNLKQRFGFAILLDAHSIRSEVPMLFDGKLPDLNLGSNKGVSANADLIALSFGVLSGKSFSSVLDGRFRGGFITRHYGQPVDSVHALQLEMAQQIYMREMPPEYEPQRAKGLISLLSKLVHELSEWSPANV
jgi:N-formylglutamate deformylase